MPKELHEITKFTSGTITVPDEKDIPEDAASYSIDIDSVTEGGKLKGVPADFTLTASGFIAAAQPEKTLVKCVADSSDSLDGKYFDITTAAGKTEIWIDTDNSGTSAPSGSGSYADVIEVTQIGTNDSAQRVAVALASAINEDAGGYSTAEVNFDTVTITDGANATRTNSAEGDTGFTISTLQEGASGTSSLTAGGNKYAMINNDGQRDVVRYNASDNKLHTITDLYRKNGSIGQTDLGAETSSADEVTMQVHNKEVHIGMGKGSTDTPKWIGYVDHKQFGTAVTAIQDESAELVI